MNQAARTDQIIAEQLDRAGSIASGLALEAIGEDGHAVANLIWKIAAHVKQRNTRTQETQ